MKHAYSYIRFSSPEQAKGDSFRRQSEKAKEWAAKNGYEIVEVISDLGRSGYHGDNVKRGRLGKFLALVDAGKIEKGSVLLVESLDRFSRNTVRQVMPDFLNCINEGIGIVTLADERLYTAETLDKDNFQLLASLIVMTRAHEESERKGQRVASAWANKRDRARAVSEKLSDRIPGWLKVVSEGTGKSKKRTFDVDPDREAVVRRIFDEIVQGYGRREIAKRLNREVRQGRTAFSSFGTKKVPGTEEVKKDNWHASYIAKIVRSRAVLGEYQPHRRDGEGKREPDGPVIKNYYPAIIDEELWLRADAELKKRQATRDANGRPQAEAVNLIGSLTRCECGARMAFLNKGRPPKGGRYYTCSDNDRENGCRNGRYWKWETVEHAIIYHLGKAAIEHAFEPGGDPIGQSPQKYDELIKDLARKMERALEAIGDSKDLKGDQVLVGRIRRWKEEKQAAEAQRDAASRAEVTRPDLARAQANWKAALAFADQFKNAQGDDLVKLRRNMILQLRAVFAEVRFSRDSIHVAVELPRRPENVIGSPLAPSEVEEKTVEGIVRYYLLSMIYTEDPRYLRRLGAPRGPGEGIFVSSFATVA